MNTGSIYNPVSTSYKDRMCALQGTLKAKHEVQKSKEFAHHSMWSNVLGSPEEIEQAEQTIELSLGEAAKDIHNRELNQAVNEGLLTEQDVREIMTAIHRYETSKKRGEMSSDETKQSDQQS